MVRCGLMKLRLEHFSGLPSECSLDELAGLAAPTAHEALGFDTRLTVRSDDDFDGLAQAAPPT